MVVLNNGIINSLSVHVPVLHYLRGVDWLFPLLFWWLLLFVCLWCYFAEPLEMSAYIVWLCNSIIEVIFFLGENNVSETNMLYMLWKLSTSDLPLLYCPSFSFQVHWSGVRLILFFYVLPSRIWKFGWAGYCSYAEDWSSWWSKSTSTLGECGRKNRFDGIFLLM